MRRVIPTLIALGALAIPATAPAKEAESATVCGSAGCASSHDRKALLPLLDGNVIAASPQRPAPYFTVRLRMAGSSASDSWVIRWVPSLGLIRAENDSGPTWVRAAPEAVTLLRRLTQGLRPFPADGLRPLHPQSSGQLAPEVTAPAAAHGSGVSTAGWIAIGFGGLLLAGGATVLALRVRRRHRSSDGPLPAGA
jgi:hypothetical protein